MYLPTTLAQHPWSSTTPSLLQDFNQLHLNARLTSSSHASNPPPAPKPVVSRKLVNPDEGKDPLRWNLIIKSFSHGWDPKEALVVLGSMLENGVVGDKYTYSLVLMACSRLGLVREGMQVYGLLSKSGLCSDLFGRNYLIGLYMGCGRHESARLVFDGMPARDSVTYNSMIDGYVKGGWVGHSQISGSQLDRARRNRSRVYDA